MTKQCECGELMDEVFICRHPRVYKHFCTGCANKFTEVREDGEED